MSDNYLANAKTVQAKDNISVILQNLKDLLKDTDDPEIKERVSDFLKNITDVYTFVVLGEVKAGKSSFINALVGENICAVSSAPCTREIHEIRHGAESVEFRISDSYKRQFTSSEVLRDIAIVDTPGTNSINAGDELVTQKFIPASDLLIVVLPAHNPHNDAVWKLVKQFQQDWNKKLLFVIQQKDLLDNESLRQIEASVRSYATQMGVTNPLVISVSAEDELGGRQNDSGYKQVRDYISNSVTGTDAMLAKQQSDLQAVQQVIKQLDKSFEKRIEQFREDRMIVEEINKSLQDFRDSHQENISQLIQGVHQVVDDEIEKYRQEIIRRLEPTTIRERFPERTAFEEWLITLNGNYAKILNEAIDRKSQKAIRSYIADMEDVLNICLKYITDRNERLDAEDIFYGSLAKSKQSVSKISQVTISDISSLNKDLLNASIELFAGVWAARREYDKNMLEKLQKTTAKGFKRTVGASAGTAGVAAALIGGAAIAGITIEAPVIAIAVAAVIVVALAGVIATKVMEMHAKKMGEAIYGAQMEEKVQQCIAKFCEDVEKSRLEIRETLEKDITDLFTNELMFMERSFLEFRLSTHVDSERLPVLEQQLTELKNEVDSFFAENQVLRLNAVNSSNAVKIEFMQREKEVLPI